MENIRWYDKNPELSEIFEFIRGLDESMQAQIAQDILQILLNEFGLNLDEKINEISKSYDFQCKRWYDNNIDFYTSFAIIKSLPDELKSEVVKRIVESVMLTYLEGIAANG